MLKKSYSTALDKIKTLEGHRRSAAIEDFVKAPNKDSEKISILLFALSDADYRFCNYDGCVASAAAYLYDLREALSTDCHRKDILTVLLDELDVSFSNTDDNLERVRLLGVFTHEARPALAALKSALSDLGDDSEYANEPWYRHSFEFECRSTLENTIRLIEGDISP